MNKPPGVKNELQLLGTLNNNFKKIQVCLVLLSFTISSTIMASKEAEARASFLCKGAVYAIVDAAGAEKLQAAKRYQQSGLRKTLNAVRDDVVSYVMKDCKGGCTPEEIIESVIKGYEVQLGRHFVENPAIHSYGAFAGTAAIVAVLAGTITHFWKESAFGAVMAFMVSTLSTPFLLGSGHAIFQKVTAKQALKALSNEHLQRNMLANYYNLAYWVEKATLTLIEAEARTCYDAFEAAVLTPIVINVEEELKDNNPKRAAEKMAFIVGKMHVGHPELDYTYPFFRLMVQTWIARPYLHEKADPNPIWDNPFVPKPQLEKPVMDWKTFQAEVIKSLKTMEADFAETEEGSKITFDYRRISVYLDFWLNPNPKLVIEDEKKHIESIWGSYGKPNKARKIDAALVGHSPVVVTEFTTLSYLQEKLTDKPTLYVQLDEMTTAENFKERLAKTLTMHQVREFDAQVARRKWRISRFVGSFAKRPVVTVDDLEKVDYHLVIMLTRDIDTTTLSETTTVPTLLTTQMPQVSDFVRDYAASHPSNMLVFYNPYPDAPNPFARGELRWKNLDELE